MNIFALDPSPEIAAHYHNNKHCIKMILEGYGLMCNALYIHDEQRYRWMYSCGSVFKPAFMNHPCTKWTAASYGNFEWLNALTIFLCEEYTFRYGKKHSIEDKARNAHKWFFTSFQHLPVQMTPFYLAMPDDCKVDTPYESYRNYYMKYKRHLAQWGVRGAPWWWK